MQVAKGVLDVARRKRTSNNGAVMSKADSIRSVARTMSRPVRPRDVIAALATQGITASSAQVSTVLGKMGLRKRSGNGKAALRRGRRKSADQMVWLAHLLAAKRLVEELGGLEPAKAALDALARLS